MGLATSDLGATVVGDDGAAPPRVRFRRGQNGWLISALGWGSVGYCSLHILQPLFVTE
jgi:hypothetical protein